MPQVYDIGKTIGEGTFGKVRKGVHRLTGLTVAIKILEKAKVLLERVCVCVCVYVCVCVRM
jgi:serine/threonine protein kinase